ncbi:MAG: chemotaxis protein [Bdellovibrionota bacterium]
MAKTVDPRAIIRRIKAKDLEKTKGNVTYSLTKTVVEEFRRACEKQDVGQGRVLEEFMLSFIEASKGSK